MLKISNNKVYNRLGSKKKADKPQDSSNKTHKETTYNRKSPPLEVCHSHKSSGMWNIKHEIISPKFYGIFIKKYLKGENDINLKKFYNTVNICPNVVAKLQEDILTSYKRTYKKEIFSEECFRKHSYQHYTCNEQTFTSLV